MTCDVNTDQVIILDSVGTYLVVRSVIIISCFSYYSQHLTGGRSPCHPVQLVCQPFILF